MKCLRCGNRSDGKTANFCSQCGIKYPEESDLPFIGVHKERGIFRITFAPVEDEFDHQDGAEDAARHSGWNEDNEFKHYKVEFVRSTVTAETHPFICGSCGLMVVEHTEGKCENCGETNWIHR